MSEIKFPVIVYHPDSRTEPKKTLLAHTQVELDALIRVGWKIKN